MRAPTPRACIARRSYDAGFWPSTVSRKRLLQCEPISPAVSVSVSLRARRSSVPCRVGGWPLRGERITMRARVSQGLFALGGVLLGGLLTGAVTYVLESKRERKAIRAAARVLIDAIKSPMINTQVLLEDGRWFVAPGDDARKHFSTELWEEHRQLLAAGLSPDGWRAVSNAFRSLRGLGAIFAQRSSEDPPDEARRFDIDILYKNVEASAGALARVADLPSRSGKG
jgi:hypothetical protein